MMKEHIEKQTCGITDEFTVNKHQDLNGVTIINNGIKFKAAFPPHTAKHIIEQLKKGDLVELYYTIKNKSKANDHQAKPENDLLKIKILLPAILLTSKICLRQSALKLVTY